MPCPTCNHTMQNLGLDQAKRRSFWCPRCGTVKTEIQGTFSDGCGGSIAETRQEHETPYLVKRVVDLVNDPRVRTGANLGVLRGVREAATGNPD